MGVVVRDARRLSPQAQEDLRRRSVAAVKAGHTQAVVSTVLGVSPQAVSRWVNAFNRKGNRALQTGRRGRRPGEQQALDPRRQARVRRAILHKIPDQVALPGLVWTRPQVRQLVRDWFGVGLSLVTIGKYLRSWGLFTCYHGTFTGPLFLTYLDRLTRHLDRKIHLIVDGHPVHRRVNVREWLTGHADRIEMHFLPGYAPELNPVELLNRDIKHHVAQANPANPTELAAAAASHLRRRQNQPDAVKAFFRKPEVLYAAA